MATPHRSQLNERFAADWPCDIAGVSVPAEFWTIWIDTSKILLASL
jgi:hypothetical protein